MNVRVPATMVILATRSSSVTQNGFIHQLLHIPPKKEIQTREVKWWLSDDADVRMFGVVEPVGWESAVDTLSLQLVHFHSQTRTPDACQPFQHA